METKTTNQPVQPFNGRQWLDLHNYNTVKSRTNSGKFPVYTACGQDFFDQSDEQEKFGPMSEEENSVTVGTDEWHEYLAYKESRKGTAKGCLEALQWLYENGAKEDVVAVTPEGNTPMRLAAYNGNLDIVKFLYSTAAREDVSKPNNKGSKPMSAACYEGHVHIVKFLLECNCHTDLPGAQYHSTSHMTLAAQNGHVELMQFLYDNGCEQDINHVDDRGMVPMMYAAQQDNLDVMEFLYTHGGEESLHHRRPHDGVTTLGAAITSAKLETVKWFVDHGASTTAKSTQREVTPMIIAAQGNGGVVHDGTAKSYLEIMKYLHENGGKNDISCPMDDGSTPMHYVAYNGDIETAKWLKSLGVDLSAASKDSRTPMLCAAMTGSVEMLDYLYYQADAQADVRKFYFDGTFTLLHAAASNGKLDAVKWLVERLPTDYPFLKDSAGDGSNAFLNACKNNHMDVIKWWYDRFHHDSRFNLNLKNYNEDGALVFAVTAGNVELLNFLYDHGLTEVNKPVKHKCITLLQIACKCCHLDVMRWLGEKGAVKAAPSFPYLDFFGERRGPSFMHTTLTTNFFENILYERKNVTNKTFDKRIKLSYGESLRVQKECLKFCNDYGATLDDMSAPFPDPMQMTNRRHMTNSNPKGHIPLGMVIVNGHMPSILYLLQIGATGRKEFKQHDEIGWMNCLAHERTKEEEKVLRDKFKKATEDTMNGGDAAGMMQMVALTNHFSRSKKKGTNSCPLNTKKYIMEFAKHVVESHHEYHTFQLCTLRAATLDKHLLEPFGRAAFAHVKTYIRDCLIVQDESTDNLQKCFQVCTRLCMRFGLRCGNCGVVKGKTLFRCCDTIYCSKSCQAEAWGEHRKIHKKKVKKDVLQETEEEKESTKK